MNGLICQNPCYDHPAERVPPASGFVFHIQHSIFTESLHTHFPLAASGAFNFSEDPYEPGMKSSRFFPSSLLPVFLGRTSSLLWNHLPPAPLKTRLGSPFVRILPSQDDTGLLRSIVRTPVRFIDPNHTQVSPNIRIYNILKDHPPALPHQVHLRSGHFTSYRFLQTFCYQQALAGRIVFPSVGATLASFSWAL